MSFIASLPGFCAHPNTGRCDQRNPLRRLVWASPGGCRGGHAGEALQRQPGLGKSCIQWSQLSGSEVKPSWALLTSWCFTLSSWIMGEGVENHWSFGRRFRAVQTLIFISMHIHTNQTLGCVWKWSQSHLWMFSVRGLSMECCCFCSAESPRTSHWSRPWAMPRTPSLPSPGGARSWPLQATTKNFASITRPGAAWDVWRDAWVTVGCCDVRLPMALSRILCNKRGKFTELCRFVPSSCKADYRRLQMAMTVAIYPDSCSHPEYAHALHCKLLWVWNFPGGPETPSWCASHRLGDVCRTRYRQGRAKCRCAASCSSRLPRTGWSARGAYPILRCILVDGSIKPHALEVYSLIDLYWINRDESWWNHFQSAYHWPDVDAFMPCRSRSRARHRQWQQSFGRSDGSTPQRNSCKSTPLRTPILTTLSPPFLQCAILLLFGVVLFESDVMFPGGSEHRREKG